MSSSAHPGPLSGVRVLVGRARHQASALSDRLRAQGAEVIEIPFIEIRQRRSYKAFDTALNRIAEYDWLVLTSVNGVDALSEGMKRVRITPESVRQLSVAAIGPATRKAIEKLGLKVAVVPAQYVAESVVESLREKVKGKRLLLVRARVARDVIPIELQKMGARVDVIEAYETVVPESSRRELQQVMSDPERRPHLITFTSSSTVRNFVELLGGRGHPPHTEPVRIIINAIKLASIGPVTSATLRELDLPVHIEAEEYTISGLVQAISSEKK